VGKIAIQNGPIWTRNRSLWNSGLRVSRCCCLLLQLPLLPLLLLLLRCSLLLQEAAVALQLQRRTPSVNHESLQKVG